MCMYVCMCVCVVCKYTTLSHCVVVYYIQPISNDALLQASVVQTPPLCQTPLQNKVSWCNLSTIHTYTSRVILWCALIGYDSFRGMNPEELEKRRQEMMANAK